MGWFSSLFFSDNSQYSRKGQALSSTHEAFSLPTTSPTLTPHPDAFNSDALNTPDLDATSPSYTYPPQGTGAYGYVPTSAGLNSRPASTTLLPTHFDPNHTLASPKFSYPPLSSTWNRVRAWLDREYPELGDTLNYGILPQDLAHIEMQFGFALPPVVRESYLCVDGQEAESAAGCSEGLFFGLKFLPLEDVLDEWKFWREVDEDPTTGANSELRDAMHSIPPGWIRKEYSQRGWIPLIADKAGNYVGIDLNPGESGSVGQVIVFGRDFDTKVVLWRGDGPTGWAKWLASFVEELESGEGIELGTGNEGSDESEDDLGYESYFYDGSGRGQGDGGGDTGSAGGLRLTGEYRGWNVLEAWADRSLRRWHEAGVITDTSFSSGDGENKISSPAVLEIKHEPVLADVDESIPAPTALGNVTNTGKRPTPDLPMISITKPPAPLPVELPTPHDIITMMSPSNSPPSSFDEDLESGQREGMREVFRDQPKLPPLSRPSKPPQSTISHENANNDESTFAISNPRNPSSRSPSPTQRLPPSQADIPDLLADSAPVMDTKPIAPSSPVSTQPELAAVHSPELGIDSTDLTNQITDATPVPAEDSDESDPHTTVRLVGGGGVAGIVSAIETEEPRPDDTGNDTDVASVTSAASDPAPNGGKTHKKTKSGLAGLKKLGTLGGLRKKDSNSSMKGAVTMSTT